MRTDDFEARIDAVRRFNRFITRRIGVLREGLLHTPYSLTEARVLFEISHRDNLTASDLSRELGLDPGYLSRILARFEQQGLIDKVRSEADARRRLLSLAPKGREAFALLDERSRDIPHADAAEYEDQQAGQGEVILRPRELLAQSLLTLAVRADG